MEQSVALMLGIICLPLAVSLLLQQKTWMEWMQYLRTLSDHGIMILGFFHLIFGAFIVSFHWKWQGIEMVITLLGIHAIIEGVIYTLSPRTLRFILEKMESCQRVVISLGGLITIIITAIAFGEYFQLLQGELL